MSRRLTVSALFAAGLFALSAAGQPLQPPPGGDPIQPPDIKDKKQPPAEKVKRADPADAAVAAALAHDPDVQVARAKVQLAEAELAKAKQAVVLKVMTLLANIREAQSAVEQARERAAWADRMVKTGNMPAPQAQAERSKLESAQAALAKLETELKLLTGGAKAQFKVVEIPDGSANTVARGLEFLMRGQSPDYRTTATEYFRLAQLLAAGPAVQGPIPDRIRAALDKPVKLGAKGEEVGFDKALEIFKKEAGLNVTVRHGAFTGGIGPIVSEGEELPVGAWFQLYQDQTSHGAFYVRDYGLLFAGKDSAPPDAPTLTNFWKQRPPAPKGDMAPEPKEKGR
jgi:hypothetical protein